MKKGGRDVVVVVIIIITVMYISQRLKTKIKPKLDDC